MVWFEASWTTVLVVQPVPQTLLMKSMFAWQNDAVLVHSGIQTYFATELLTILRSYF